MTILCGTDLTAASSPALDVALALAAVHGDREVLLLHVVDPDASDDGDATLDNRMAAAEDRLAGEIAARRAKDATIAIRALVRGGPADATLLGTAETEHATLIVIAAGAKLGTTARKVVETTNVPVLVVRDPAPWLAYARGERPLRALLGIDESTVCDLGIQWLHALRAHRAVDVVLGAIYYPDDAAERFGVHGKNLVDRDPEVEQLLARDLVRRFGNPGAPSCGDVIARTKRGLGRIGDHVLELAAEEKVDAIVIGTSQKTGLGRLGSVSSVVIEDGPQSVLCVPPNAQLGPATIPTIERALVATDHSPFANRAIPYAFALVPPHGEVHLLHVVEDDVDEAECQAHLASLAPAGARPKLIAHVVRGDDAAQAIAQTAARLGVDVICIASHGRSGISRALVGSVADRLLRATKLPVLVLRPS